MKKFIFILVVFFTCLTLAACGNYPYREQDVEKQIKESVKTDISYDLLIPSSLKITSISYRPIDTLYLADEDYHSYKMLLKLNQESLSTAKTNRDKRLYQQFIDDYAKRIDDLIKEYYSAKNLGENIFTEPLQAYFVSVDFKFKNAYGVEMEGTRYYNTVQWKSSVRGTDGKTKYAYDCQSRESSILAMPLQAINAKIKFI